MKTVKVEAYLSIWTSVDSVYKYSWQIKCGEEKEERTESKNGMLKTSVISSFKSAFENYIQPYVYGKEKEANIDMNYKIYFNPPISV